MKNTLNNLETPSTIALPEEYLLNMKSLLGEDDYNNYINSFGQNYKSGIRANLLKTTPNELKALLNIDLEKVTWCNTGYYFDNSTTRPAKSFYYHAGLFYIQEPSAMSVGAILPINQGDKVLDLCSAPGGKSTHIASKLNNTGLIVSNDISTSRCKAVVKNIELQGITNAVIINEKPSKLVNKFNNFFDKIIVDAPCSGEGMFRKDKESIKSWTKESPSIYHSIQLEILDNAKDMLQNGGIIAYSTCTFSPLENEETILKFLNLNKNFKLIEFDKSNGFEDGQAEYVNKELLDNSSAENVDSISKTGRLFPHKIKGEGHFLALLQKIDNNSSNSNNNTSSISSSKNKLLSQKDIPDFDNFIKEYVNINTINKELLNNLYIHNNSLFSIPIGVNLDKIRVIKSGFYWGELKKNRFEPSQAFAMGIKLDDFNNTLIFQADNNDDNLCIERYLKGESFVIADKNNINIKNGWCLVAINNFPIGFGKVQNNRLKNKYCVGWKI